VGERNLVDDGGGAAVVLDEPGLHAHLAVRVLVPQAADAPQQRRAALGRVPALPRDPLGQEVGERRGEGGHQGSRWSAGGSGSCGVPAEGALAGGGATGVATGSTRSQKKSREP